jgi:hypothetical protein
MESGSSPGIEKSATTHDSAHVEPRIEQSATTGDLPHPVLDHSSQTLHRESDSPASSFQGVARDSSSIDPVALAVAPLNSLSHDLADNSGVDRPRGLVEEKTEPTKPAVSLPHVSESVPALNGALIGTGDITRDHHGAPSKAVGGDEASRTPLAASIPVAVQSQAVSGQMVGGESRSAFSEENGGGVVGRGQASTEGMTVPAAGLLGRSEEPFEGSSASSNSSISMGGQIGGDSFSSHDGGGAAQDDSRTGGDMTRTNTLLEQILNELRQNAQPAYVQSSRSVYPER